MGARALRRLVSPGPMLCSCLSSCAARPVLGLVHVPCISMPPADGHLWIALSKSCPEVPITRSVHAMRMCAAARAAPISVFLFHATIAASMCFSATMLLFCHMGSISAAHERFSIFSAVIKKIGFAVTKRYKPRGILQDLLFSGVLTYQRCRAPKKAHPASPRKHTFGPRGSRSDTPTIYYKLTTLDKAVRAI